jgi:diketogulonate reductase-like aldo/keto reductase
MAEWLSGIAEWFSSAPKDPVVGTIVVGTVLSLLVLGAVIIYLLGEWGDRRQRKRELKGLLRILDIEIAANERLIRLFDEHPAWISRAPEHSLQIRAWEDARVRLTYLLKNRKQFDDIAKYYGNIQAAEEYRLLDTGAEAPEERTQQRVKQQLRLLLDLSAVAREHIRQHVPDAPVGNPPQSSSDGRDTE